MKWLLNYLYPGGNFDEYAMKRNPRYEKMLIEQGKTDIKVKRLKLVKLAELRMRELVDNCPVASRLRERSEKKE